MNSDLKRRKADSYRFFCDWYPIMIMFIWIIVMHGVMKLETKDDIWFYEISHAKDFRFWAWLHERYVLWSSRTVIEATLIISLALPHVVWRVLDSLILVGFAIVVSKVFVPNEKREYGNIFLACMMMFVDYSAMTTAGWQATTINYLWPMAALTVACYPLCKWLRNRMFQKYEYILYFLAAVFAISSEQACVVFLILYACFGIELVKEKKVFKFYFVQGTIGIIGLLNAMLCPGNTVRNQHEVKMWFPQFKQYSVFQKIDIGISSTIKSLFLETNYMFILLVVILAILIWEKQNNKLFRLLGTIPVIVVLTINIIGDVIGRNHKLFQFVRFDGVIFGENQITWKIMLLYAGLLSVCAVIMFDFMIVASDIRAGVVINIFFLVGLMTKAMLGFSATVWASYTRTGWFCQFSFLCCILYMLCMREKTKRKSTYWLVGCFVLFAIIGGIYNYTEVFSIVHAN